MFISKDINRPYWNGIERVRIYEGLTVAQMREFQAKGHQIHQKGSNALIEIREDNSLVYTWHGGYEIKHAKPEDCFCGVHEHVEDKPLTA